MSTEVVSLFTIGFGKPIYSRLTLRTRIALRSIGKRSGSTTSSTIARGSLTELAEKHDVEDALFPVDDADDLIGGLRRENYGHRVGRHGFSNSVEYIFKEVEV